MDLRVGLLRAQFLPQTTIKIVRPLVQNKSIALQIYTVVTTSPVTLRTIFVGVVIRK
jgi:hypothetical protein